MSLARRGISHQLSATLGWASTMSFYCYEILRILAILLWILWKTAEWLFKFLDPPTGIPLNTVESRENMLFKQSRFKALNKCGIEKHGEDPEILQRLDRLTQESNTLLKILFGLGRPKEDGRHLENYDNDTDISEEDMSEDEGSILVSLSMLRYSNCNSLMRTLSFYLYWPFLASWNISSKQAWFTKRKETLGNSKLFRKVLKLFLHLILHKIFTKHWQIMDAEHPFPTQK